MKPYIFTVCDTGFYDRFAIPLRNSAEAHGNHLEIFKKDFLAETQEQKSSFLTWRLILMPELIEKYDRVLLLDADSIIRQPILANSKWQIGLFLREERPDIARKVFASAVYGTRASLPFFKKLAAKAEKSKWAWFADQAMIWKQYVIEKDHYRIKVFNKDFIDWTCGPDAKIWTGKGDRKNSKAEFVEAVEYWKVPHSLPKAQKVKVEPGKDAQNDMRGSAGDLSLGGRAWRPFHDVQG